MEQQPILNEHNLAESESKANPVYSAEPKQGHELNAHNKQEFSPMHIDGTNTLLKNKALQKCGILLLVLVVSLSLTSCLNNLLVKVEPITVGNSSGGKTTVYFRDTDHDVLFLSTIGKHSDVWDTTFNIAILYKPIYFKISGDTLQIMGDKPDYFRPELTDANIIYHWREGNPLCYEEQARADDY
jgi:hypothetical protein